MAEVRMEFGKLEWGFFRYNGTIYFAKPHGRMVFHFPVKDGKICSKSDRSNIYPNEVISVIPWGEMVNHGMQIGQGDSPFDKRYWS